MLGGVWIFPLAKISVYLILIMEDCVKLVLKPAAEKVAPKDTDAKRAAAILAGQSETPAAKPGEYLILIGAFSNEANVLRTAYGQQRIRTFDNRLRC